MTHKHDMSCLEDVGGKLVCKVESAEAKETYLKIASEEPPPRPTGTEIIAKIREHLTAGGFVQVVTYTRATQFGPRHLDFFKVGRDGAALARYGKRWDDITHTGIRFLVLRTPKRK